MRAPDLSGIRYLSAGLLLMVLVLVAYTAPVRAASTSVDTKLKLKVDPLDCTVDIVDAGTGQVLQIPVHSCLPIVPEILTPVLELPETAEPSLAIPNNAPALPVILVQPNPGLSGEPWSPVATTTLSGRPFKSSSSAGTIPAMLAGIGAVATVTAIGVDAALFELSHSKSAARWARSRLKLPVKN